MGEATRLGQHWHSMENCIYHRQRAINKSSCTGTNTQTHTYMYPPINTVSNPSDIDHVATYTFHSAQPRTFPPHTDPYGRTRVGGRCWRGGRGEVSSMQTGVGRTGRLLRANFGRGDRWSSVNVDVDVLNLGA
jgi:hypothetical protein